MTINETSSYTPSENSKATIFIGFHITCDCDDYMEEHGVEWFQRTPRKGDLVINSLTFGRWYAASIDEDSMTIIATQPVEGEVLPVGDLADGQRKNNEQR